MTSKSICWIRRDLRLNDHKALSLALKSGECTLVFIFDKNILDKIKDKSDRRISFIIESLIEIEKCLNLNHSSLIIKYGDPVVEIPKIALELKAKSVFFNRDYGPSEKLRDEKVEIELKKINIETFHFKDHVYYEKKEILTSLLDVYKVFTPYKNRWLEKFYSEDQVVPNYKCDLKKLSKFENPKSIINYNWLKEIGFNSISNVESGGEKNANLVLSKFFLNVEGYHENRDFPFLNQTSNLSTYIRFGNISIRKILSEVLKYKGEGSSTFINELIWRDFFNMILDNYPKVVGASFKSEYDHLKWEGSLDFFEKWCEGQTGQPLVDSAMRCLNQTGKMHNRLRMIVASYLCKILLVDWKLGEKYFSEKLLDFDLASNNGGWQWSASTGVDANPYFRIFNPYTQSKKFDPDGLFIRKWCPELSKFNNKQIHFPHEAELEDQIKANCIIGVNYPNLLVNYKIQREKAIALFKAIKSSG